MTKREIERRIAALEADADPTICTWLDLVKAADAPPGTPLILSPAMQKLFDATLRSDNAK
jgi:hypothetical protein